MTSQIDATLPVEGTPTTASVRANFQTAKDEITTLQNDALGAPFLPLVGGTMTGAMHLAGDPTDALMPATKGYVDAHSTGGGGGIPEAPADSVLYGRRNGAWSQAAALADITSAINAAVVQATETVAGVAQIATAAEVTAGTDDTTFVTPLKLANKVAAAPYVPLAGDSTKTGNLVLAPNTAGATASLTLNRPDGNGTNLFLLQQAGVTYWRGGQLASGTGNANDYIIQRQQGAFSGAGLRIELATPFISTLGGYLNLGCYGQSSQQLPMVAGPVTPANAGSDALMIAARRAANADGTYFDGAYLYLNGPTSSTTPGGAVIYTGTKATGYSAFVFGLNGNLTVPGILQVSNGVSVTGNLNINAGNITTTGSAITVQPSGAGISAQLTLTKPDNNAYNLIYGDVGATVLWQQQLGAQTTNDFVIVCGSGGAAGERLRFHYGDTGALLTGALTVTGNVTASGALASGPLTVTGNVAASGALTVSGNVTAPEFLSAGGAAKLATGNGDTLAFTWQGSYTFLNYGVAGNITVTNGQNVRSTQMISGGPTGNELYIFDTAGSNYTIYVDVNSDRRLKQDIRDTDTDALGALRAIPVRAFDWSDAVMADYDEVHRHVDLGLVAQEVAEEIPAVVKVRGEVLGRAEDDPPSPYPDDVQSIRYDMLVPYLIRAVQQLADAVESRR
jgi:hypothetical protein